MSNILTPGLMPNSITGIQTAFDAGTAGEKSTFQAAVSGHRPGLVNLGGGVPVSMRPSGLNLNNKTVTSHMVRMVLMPQVPLQTIRVLYDNIGTSDIVVSGALELQSGNKIQMRFPDGSASCTIKPGGEVWANATAISYPGPAAVPTSANMLYLRTYVTLATGQLACRASCLRQGGIVSPAGVTDSWVDNGGVDLTMSTLNTGMTNANGYIYAPRAVIGTSGRYAGPIVLGFGDSNANAQADGPLLSSGGWITRVCIAKKLPMLLLGYPGRTFPTFDPSSDIGLGLVGAAGAKYGLVQCGTNNLVNGSALTAIKAAALLTWTQLYDMGISPIGVTLPPRTSSTDAYTTLAGQTPNGAAYVGGTSSVRNMFNDWVRTKPWPLYDIVDAAIDCQDPIETDKWGVAGGAKTQDGTHIGQSTFDAIAFRANSLILA